MSEPLADYERADWILTAEQLSEKAALARRFGQEGYAEIYEKGIPGALAMANKWRLRLIGGK